MRVPDPIFFLLFLFFSAAGSAVLVVAQRWPIAYIGLPVVILVYLVIGDIIYSRR